MSYTRHHFHLGKSIDDFLAENLLNRVIYECLKKDAMLPDETILDAFKKAYQTCNEVLNEPERQTLLSEGLNHLAANAPRSSLLRLCLTFFILSFHEEATTLRRYLSNLKEVLETHFKEIFQPLMAVTSSLSPESVIMDDRPSESLQERRQDYIKISTLIKKAQELTKHDADIFLKILLTIIAEDESDWTELIKIAIKQNHDRIERAPSSGPYHISKRKEAAFIKLFRIIYELHIFEKADRSIASSYEEFIYNAGIFFNAEIKNIRSRLSSTKRTDNFMDVFDRIHALADAYYKNGDGLEDDTNESIQFDYQQDIDFESF